MIRHESYYLPNNFFRFALETSPEPGGYWYQTAQGSHVKKHSVELSSAASNPRMTCR